MKNLTYSLALLLVLVFSSCSEQARISRQYTEFTSNNIVFPSSFHKVESGQVGISETFPEMPVMILYNDSLSCSLCQIHHLHDRLPIYELADSLRTFAVMTVLSPNEEEYSAVVDALIDRNIDFPVYIDHSGDFARHNPHIPKDDRFHCFLVDSSGKPVFVGNPVRGTALWDLFCVAVDNLNAE